MTHQELTREETICRRKERRYKAEEDRVRCETTISNCGLRRGSVLDLSTSGVRLLCEGTFEVSQPIFTELTTDRSHGIYRGIIRRVQPWVGGKSVLGCSLDDPIPESVLQDLAGMGAVNRRAEDRIDFSQDAKVSWPLSQEEVDVELRDYSPGGMKILASKSIPDGVRLRFRVEQDGDEDLVIEAKSVWQQECDEGCLAGVAFTQRDAPVQFAASLGLNESSSAEAPQPTSSRLRRALVLAFGAATVGYAVLTMV